MLQRLCTWRSKHRYVELRPNSRSSSVHELGGYSRRRVPQSLPPINSLLPTGSWSCWSKQLREAGRISGAALLKQVGGTIPGNNSWVGERWERSMRKPAVILTLTLASQLAHCATAVAHEKWFHQGQ